MFRIAICDCSIKDIDQLYSMIEASLADNDIQATIDIYQQGETFIHDLQMGKQIDLLFIEIDLGMEDGKQIVHQFQEELHIKDIKVVFMSYSLKDIMSLFELKPYHFITKPLRQSMIQELVVEISNKHYKALSYSHYQMGKIVNK